MLRKSIALKNNPDEIMRSTLNLKEHLTNREAGIYQVTINDKNSNAIAHLTVQVTDMNLITKRYPVDGGGEMVSAWVLNSRNNEPMSNVNMSIVYLHLVKSPLSVNLIQKDTVLSLYQQTT